MMKAITQAHGPIGSAVVAQRVWGSGAEPFQAGTWVAENERCLGRLEFADGIRESASDMLEQLTKIGVSTQLILTGDASEEAERVSAELGIQHVIAGALPEEKWQLGAISEERLVIPFVLLGMGLMMRWHCKKPMLVSPLGPR